MKPFPYLYTVVFHQNNVSDYGAPIIWVEKDKNPYDSGSCLLLDKDMEELPSIIEYILQLPRGDFDLFDLNENLLNYCVENPHFIIILPDSLRLADVNQWEAIIDNTDGLFLCDSVDSLILNKEPLLGVHRACDIGNKMLKAQWEIAFENLSESPFDKLSYNPIFIKDEYLKSLQFMFLARQFQEDTEILFDLYQSTRDKIDQLCSKYLYYLIIKQRALSSLNKELFSNNANTTENDAINYIKNNLDSRMKAVAKTTHIDVVITYPGISKRQRKLLNISSVIPDVEYRTVKVMGLHRAIAQNAFLIEIKATSDKLYQLLDELEQQIKFPSGTNNPHIWKTLRDIGKEFATILSTEQENLIRQAPHICAFSEYPLGLAILPDQEVPLSISHSVYYEPLIPLSRHLTIELSEINNIMLYEKCRILFIECIPNNESNKIVYDSSEFLASQIRSMASGVSIATFSHEEAHNKEELKQIFKRYPQGTMDVLILSAHGFYDTDSNCSGLCIGENDLWMADDNDILVPPIVLLSACHVSPRGRNTISAGDLLMRAGAMVVLSTLIPINVYRNTLLYSRLFVYIFEAIKGEKQYKTLADAWTGVVATNAVNEILENSEKLKHWYMSKNSKGVKRIEDFTIRRSSGKLLFSNIYSGTISILKEMLAEEGLSDKYDSILNVDNCFPESFFYQMIGYPKNVFLNNPMSPIKNE